MSASTHSPVLKHHFEDLGQQHACERLGMSPGQTLCVGDDLENDVLGPERAGLRGLLLDRDGRGPEGIASLPDMTALVTALLNLEKQGGLCR